MLFPWYKKFSLKRKSKDLIKSTGSVLSDNGSLIEPSVVKSGREKIDELKRAIGSDSIEQIEPAYKDLKEFTDKKLDKFGKSKLRQNIESIIIALALALLIRTFVIQPFKIPSGSMIPSLLIGDHLLVNKFVYGTNIPFSDIVIMPIEDISRGDVIVFKFPEDSETGPRKGVHYIKRVIGIEGDRVDIEGNDIYINNEKVEQKYIGDYAYEDNGLEITADMYKQFFPEHEFRVLYKKGSSSTTKGKLGFPITVPDGSVFVMGDNRDNSYDSRFWGFVPVENISGKAFMIHWSWDFDNSSIIDIIRWGRIFKPIN